VGFEQNNTNLKAISTFMSSHYINIGLTCITKDKKILCKLFNRILKSIYYTNIPFLKWKIDRYTPKKEVINMFDVYYFILKSEICYSH